MDVILARKDGTNIRFHCSISIEEARTIVLDAHRAGQNVGDFALKLATQRRALSTIQGNWLKYLAMEINGDLRAQVEVGPWAWLLERPNYETKHVQVSSPPAMGNEQRNPCRWVRVRFEREWRYVGLIDCHGGFHFSKEISQLISGEGRSAVASKFPDEEERLLDQAKRLQWIASQQLEALKRHAGV